jgi:hypothetical protein
LSHIEVSREHGASQLARSIFPFLCDRKSGVDNSLIWIAFYYV